MSTAEIKTEIEKVLDAMPESVLESVLQYLKSVTVSKQQDIDFSNNLRKILSEDKELLQKLAQ